MDVLIEALEIAIKISAFGLTVWGIYELSFTKNIKKVVFIDSFAILFLSILVYCF